MMIELENIELFKDLTFLELEIGSFDLHNDYECSNISLSEVDNSLKSLFEPGDKHADKLCLVFQKTSIKKFDFFLNRTLDSSTINSIYRGRFEKELGLQEYSASGEGYYYIEFEQGDKIELLAEKIIVLQI